MKSAIKRNRLYDTYRKNRVERKYPRLVLLLLTFVFLTVSNCKTTESGKSVSIVTPRYLRLNYDVVYETSEGVTLHESGKLFARGLFYDFTIRSSANQFERIKASSYTEDNQVDFKHILTNEELNSLENKQYQYFSMPNDSRASVLTGIHNGHCYVRWVWQKDSFIFVFETDVKNDSEENPATLGKKFHENIRNGLRIF
ncbi:hypothetical protein [Leptospira alstonii]|uniref:Uncharacterized protein n=2 Tax=Leptospira alstonii TaxID=28452 RepID=M6D5R3_9LEPT|nr:hypothetical protein [Leptospira alstonii]EMJ96583.1 hypothetical protein LEP1GSC194_4247 [Leptospira alstonii serovar Sichuan str. 79601]EQA78704.1 hypothetical protein LEP1GSC193_1635 [Leptospira alstonii serovar Pingchang str. 80-412]